jgi:peptidoglycan hydrolase CwlO-like protein
MSAMDAKLRITTSYAREAAFVALVVAAALAFALAAPHRAGASPSLAQLQKEARTVRAQMAQLNADMKVIAQRYQEASAHLDAVNAQLAQTRLQLTRAQDQLARQREVVASRVVTMYKTDDYSWLDIIASSSSLSDAQTAVDFLRKIAEEDQRTEKACEQLAAQVKTLEKNLEHERQDTADAQAEIDAQRLSMEEKLAERSALLKNLVVRIKKILSAPELLMKAGGKVTQVTWAQALLKSLPEPLTSDNVAAIVAWEMAEGGHWYNAAHYNPLNTTQSMPGATVFNSVGVKAYTTWAQGLKATVITLHNGLYGGILAALHGGNDAEAVAGAVAASPWGTGSFSVSR